MIQKIYFYNYIISDIYLNISCLERSNMTFRLNIK